MKVTVRVITLVVVETTPVETGEQATPPTDVVVKAVGVTRVRPVPELTHCAPQG